MWNTGYKKFLRSEKNISLKFYLKDIHKQLEAKIAKFHDREDCILYASCFDANAGIFETLLGTEDAVISDELNHASIIDGIRLCKSQRLRYKHKDMNGNYLQILLGLYLDFIRDLFN
jgi:7-keto-8-aminopelargonate synthetase-like enzyme